MTHGQMLMAGEPWEWESATGRSLVTLTVALAGWVIGEACLEAVQERTEREELHG